MFSWNSLAFSMIQQMLAIWSLVPLLFLKPAWASGSSRFTYCWMKPGLENFEHYFTSVWDECNCAVVWAFFGIPFLWDWNENWPFLVLWPLLSFPNLRTEILDHHNISHRNKWKSKYIYIYIYCVWVYIHIYSFSSHNFMEEILICILQRRKRKK